jgi:hypothetical protein
VLTVKLTHFGLACLCLGLATLQAREGEQEILQAHVLRQRSSRRERPFGHVRIAAEVLFM